MAQEHGRQRRRRHPRRGRGRRRPEPQLRHQLGPRQRGLLGRPDLRDVPRHRPGLRARDEGDERAVEQGRLRLPEERPHRVGAAAVSAATSSTRRRPTTASSRRWPATTSTRRSPTRRSTRATRTDPTRPGRSTDSPLDEDESRQPLRPGPRGRALHHQRRHARRRLPHTASSASRRRAPCRSTENVSGFEFQDDEDDVEAEFQRHLLFSLDLARSAERSGEPGLAPRQRRRRLLRRRVRRLLRRSAERRGDAPSGRSATCGCATASTTAGCSRPRPRRRRAASGSTTTKGVFFQRLRGEVKGTEPGDEVEVWFEAERTEHSKHFTYTARQRERATRCWCSPPRTTWPATRRRIPTGRTT